jgi:hypothetical protein
LQSLPSHDQRYHAGQDGRASNDDILSPVQIRGGRDTSVNMSMMSMNGRPVNISTFSQFDSPTATIGANGNNASQFFTPGIHQPSQVMTPHVMQDDSMYRPHGAQNGLGDTMVGDIATGVPTVPENALAPVPRQDVYVQLQQYPVPHASSAVAATVAAGSPMIVQPPAPIFPHDHIAEMAKDTDVMQQDMFAEHNQLQIQQAVVAAQQNSMASIKEMITNLHLDLLRQFHEHQSFMESQLDKVGKRQSHLESELRSLRDELRHRKS